MPVKPLNAPAEPENVRTVYIEALEHHATALGYFCIEFANLEFTVDTMIERALACSEDQARVIVTASGQFGNRCNLLKGLLYAITDLPSDSGNEWRELCETTLNIATGSLAAARNRLIHDAWVHALPPADPKQWNMQVRVAKPQAHQPKGLSPVLETDRPLAAIWIEVRRIQCVIMMLQILDVAYMELRGGVQHAQFLRRLERARTVLNDLPPSALEVPSRPL